MAFGRDDFLAQIPKTVADIPREEVAAFGGTVYVRSMTVTERDQFEQDSRAIKDAGEDMLVGVRARIIAACVCDDTGKLLFSSADVPALSRLDSATGDRIFSVAARMTGMQDADVKDLEKN